MAEKLTFLGKGRPLVVCMIQSPTVADVLQAVRDGSADGADAFGLQLERLPDSEKTDEKLKECFAAMGDHPCYVTNYRYYENEGKSDEVLAEELLHVVSLGATLVDVIGDLYEPNEGQFPTAVSEAAEKKRALCERIHRAGGEVLMSSHVMRFLPAEKLLDLVETQASLGADIAKVVTGAETAEEEAENLLSTVYLKEHASVPFLFLSGGECARLRTVGPLMGGCMWLTVHRHDEFSTPQQPLCRAIRLIADKCAPRK